MEPERPEALESEPQGSNGGTARNPGSILQRAKLNDPAALEVMFRQFVPNDETILAVQFLGTQGVWGIGVHSFACVTDRRIAAIKVKLFGEVAYQDGSLEHVNSAVVYQPSKALLYLFVIASSILTLGIGLLLLPVTVRLFYSFKKSGLLVSVREGVAVYMFSDRKLLKQANVVYRTALAAREHRLAGLRGGPFTAPGKHPQTSAVAGQGQATEQKEGTQSPFVAAEYKSEPRKLIWVSAVLVLSGAVVVGLLVISRGGEAPISDGREQTDPPLSRLDQLAEECGAGDFESCDALYFESPAGSDYEYFGATCGHFFTDAENAGNCA